MDELDLQSKLQRIIRERRALIEETLMNGLLKDMEQYKYLQGELRALDLVRETIQDYLKEAR
jgi:hypothetical protein